MASIATVVDVAGDSTTVTDKPGVLTGIYVNTVLSAHACLIVDGSTTKLTLPASLAAGTNLQFPDGIVFASTIVVDPDNSATGNITVFWKPRP